MATVFETEVCSRCNGTGRFSFNGEHSRCYKCDGQNDCRAYTKRGAAAKAYYDEKFMVAASEIKIGDKVWKQPARLTVEEIEIYMPSGRAWINGVEVAKKEHFRFKNAAGMAISVPTDEKIRRIPSQEERDAAIADALAYQATLTKNGTPRKK